MLKNLTLEMNYSEGLALLTCLFCGWMCGLAAIICAVSADSNYPTDQEAARENLKWSHTCAGISLVVGIIVWVYSFVYISTTQH